MTYISVEKVRRNMVNELFKKYSCGSVHSELVEIAAVKIFDATRIIHGLGNSDRSLLSYACLLHDIGAFISEKKHHRHSQYLILNDVSLADFPQDLREQVALIAYNHRKKIDKDTYDLSRNRQAAVLKLSAILRVADALYYSRSTEMTIIQININEDRVELLVDGGLQEKLNPRLELKKELFVEQFKRNIVIECESNLKG